MTDADVDSLRLNWQTKIEPDDVRRALIVNPGRSVWLPNTLEFAVVTPWRNRYEVANIHDLVAVQHPQLLVEAAVERARDGGADLIVSIEIEETRRPAFYDSIAFSLLQEVVTYELDPLPLTTRYRGTITFAQINPTDQRSIDLLCRIDREAFPWLWRNSDLEFRVYGLLPDVEIYVGLIAKQPVSYVGLTSFLGWGHLDRIAVLPHHQGQGIGRQTMLFAMERLARRGARRIGLSTQRDNPRSQRLYERLGFRRSFGNDYRLYGRWLNPRQTDDEQR